MKFVLCSSLSIYLIDVVFNLPSCCPEFPPLLIALRTQPENDKQEFTGT
jgi:hypothetical protein